MHVDVCAEIEGLNGFPDEQLDDVEVDRDTERDVIVSSPSLRQTSSGKVSLPIHQLSNNPIPITSLLSAEKRSKFQVSSNFFLH